MSDNESAKMDVYDLVIIGSGPAGLTAAIYACRARLKTIVLEDPSAASQAAVTDRVENYPGFPEGVNGMELVEGFRRQAVSCGAEFRSHPAKGIKVNRGVDIGKKKVRAYRVVTESVAYDTLAVIIASGARPKGLDLAEEERFRNRGISYCATCDGPLFKDKVVVVVGGGNTACEEAIFLTRFASKVFLVHRRDRLRATKILQERVLGHEKIEVVWGSVIKGVVGDDGVQGVRLEDLDTGKQRELACEGIFIFVGLTPHTDFVKGVLRLNEKGHIVTDRNMQTSQRGIFACGDCRDTYLWQIVTAAGDGALAASSAQQFVDRIKGTLYI
jgi:thioredoxin reductase (NADPH)